MWTVAFSNLTKNALCVVGSECDNHNLGLLGQMSERSMAPLVLDLLVAGIDRVHCIAMVEHCEQQLITLLQHVLRCANQRIGLLGAQYLFRIRHNGISFPKIEAMGSPSFGDLEPLADAFLRTLKRDHVTLTHQMTVNNDRRVEHPRQPLNVVQTRHEVYGRFDLQFVNCL